jgi:GTP-binding protein
MGTLIWKEDEDGERYLVADICDNDPVLVAEGGKGGWGNTRFVSPTNQEPLLAQNGERGDRSILFLELKLLADVGLLACPNAGKSTLISRCSRAKPKVADYPFTTVEPVLGVVSAHGQDFVMMEVPGLLEGAHAGIGLGHQFLRHAERARVYVHILDGLADDPSEQYEMLNNELRLFSESLGGKPQVVVVNKIDVTEVRETQEEVTALIREKAKEQGIDDLDVLFMSAVTGEGVNELLGKIVELLAKTAKEAEEAEAAADAVPEPVQWGRSKRTANRITKIVGGFAVESQELERLVAMADTRDRRVLLQLWDQMNKNGIARMLEEAGIEAGDTILIGKAEISWF